MVRNKFAALLIRSAVHSVPQIRTNADKHTLLSDCYTHRQIIQRFPRICGVAGAHL